MSQNWIRIGIKRPERVPNENDASSNRSERGPSQDSQQQRRYKKYAPTDNSEVISKSMSKRSLHSLSSLAEKNEQQAYSTPTKALAEGMGELGLPLSKSKVLAMPEIPSKQRMLEQPKFQAAKNPRLEQLRLDMKRQDVKNDLMKLQQLCSQVKMLMGNMITMFRRFYADASYNLKKLHNLLDGQVQSQFRELESTGVQLSELTRGLEKKYSNISFKLPLGDLPKVQQQNLTFNDSIRLDSDRARKAEPSIKSVRANEAQRTKKSTEEGRQLSSVLMRMKNLLNKKP